MRAVYVCLALVAATSAVSQEPTTLAYVSGGATGKVFRIDTTGPVEVFSAKQGFRPEGVASDGAGRLFICDTSGSEVHVLEQSASGDWSLTTIYDKGSSVPPSPEQPVGCAIVGPDLYFGERSGSPGSGGPSARSHRRCAASSSRGSTGVSAATPTSSTPR